MRIETTRAGLREALAAARAGGMRVGLVPTMGYLHEGHLSLMRAARAESDFVVATIFVNPTQFGPDEDLDRYPRDPEGDRAKCAEAGVDLLWMPPREEVYHAAHATSVVPTGVSDALCGASRPVHFAGVATVVTKLFLLVQPERAWFGRKDAQQVAVIRQVVRDLDLPVEVVDLPTVREADGLALSSRNRYLSAEERARGLGLSRALREAAARWAAGERDADALRAALQGVLSTHLDADAGDRVDYAEVVDPETIQPIAGRATERGALAALACFVGKTRLIDNVRLDAPDRALGGRSEG